MELPISIVIPTFNEEKYLPRLLVSIQKQTQHPKEIIVADANSTDQTRDIARNFGCKVIAGGLPGAGRNNGAKVATQTYLLFLDADVILTPAFLEHTFAEMQNKHLDIASCYIQLISGSKIDMLGMRILNYYLSTTQKGSPHTSGFCILVKKSLHESINGFNEHIMLGEDIEYGKRAAKVGKFAFLTSEKIHVSMRRFQREGRIKTTFKHFIAAGYVNFAKDHYRLPFAYEFGKYYGPLVDEKVKPHRISRIIRGMTRLAHKPIVMTSHKKTSFAKAPEG